MTRSEFESIMDGEGRTPRRRALWADYTPLCSPAKFKAELNRPDGMVEVTRQRIEQTTLRGWIETTKAALLLRA